MPPTSLTKEDIINRLHQAGYEALIVGGYVRDKLLGLPAQDADLATNASPEVCQQLFSDAQIDLTGQHFRVLRVDGYELASFRGERYHQPGKPEVWEASSFEADAARRDFTINAMALTLDGNLLDPFNGQADLQARLLRAVGVAEQRFLEDPLRLLRAVGFAVRLQFTIEEGTAAAMHACAAHLGELPGERVAAEISKLIDKGLLFAALKLYQQFGFLPYILPELQHLPHQEQHSKHHHLDVWEHTLEVVHRITELAPGNHALAWAALFHDAGKGLPAEQELTEGGLLRLQPHELLGAESFAAAAERLHLAKKLAHEVSFYIRWHVAREVQEPGAATRFLNLLAASWKNKQELSDAVEHLLMLLEADCYGKRPRMLAKHLKVYKSIKDLLQKALQRLPFYLKDAGLSGTDLPEDLEGREVGRKLRQMLLVKQSELVQQWYDEYLPVSPPSHYALPEGAVLRLATDNDVPKLRLLVNAAYAELGAMGLNFSGVTQGEEETRRRMAGKEVWVIERGEQLMATIALSDEQPEPDRGDELPAWYISQFGVDPGCRELHLGTILVYHAFARARELDYQLLRLDTAVPAHHLVRFYRRFGFRIIWVDQWRGKSYPSFIMAADVRNDK